MVSVAVNISQCEICKENLRGSRADMFAQGKTIFFFQLVLASELGVCLREILSAGAASVVSFGIYKFSASFHIS